MPEPLPPANPQLHHEKVCLEDERPRATPSAPLLDATAAQASSQGQDATIQVSGNYGLSREE